MGTLQSAYWQSDGQGQTRKERQSGAYRYYVPTKLAQLDIALDADVVADVVRAEAAIRELNSKVVFLHSSEGLARFLLRAESVSSSYIEGLQVGMKRLLKAELALADQTTLPNDTTAVEIIGNIHAMEDALAQAESETQITPATLTAIHRTLLQGSRLEEYGGTVRKEQNWIGGTWHNPLQADFVPPAPEYLAALLEDLTDYCNQELVSPVQQAAIAHAQFETIHPFVDGNGRAGRALIHLVLRRRELTPTFVPPISLVLATFAQDYVNGLSGFRFTDDQSPEQIHRRLNEWVSFFAGSCVRACEEAHRFEETVLALQGSWRKKLGSVRKGSTIELLLDELPGMPMFTLRSLSTAIDRSPRAITEGVERFEAVGIVKPVGNTRRKRLFEVPDILSAFNVFERQLASPGGNTRTSKPSRPVPYRTPGS